MPASRSSTAGSATTAFPRYRRIRPLVRRVLRQIDLIAAQNDESAERFRALGAPADRVHVTGSLKYDGAQTDRDNPRTAALRKLAGFADDDIVFLAGSTQEPEEQIAIEIFRRLSLESSAACASSSSRAIPSDSTPSPNCSTLAISMARDRSQLTNSHSSR